MEEKMMRNMLGKSLGPLLKVKLLVAYMENIRINSKERLGTKANLRCAKMKNMNMYFGNHLGKLV